MNKKMSIISLGGSLIVPDAIDWEYLAEFKELILEYIHKGWRFILITGGGKTARKYQEAAHKIDETLTDEDKDWLGIHSTRLNAQLMRTIFREYAYPRINTNPHDLEDFSYCKEPIVLAAGYRPGCSTDYDATLLAKYLGIRSLVNLSNIDYVYDKDPNLSNDARAFKEMQWSDLRNLVGDEWRPGLNAPFDPIAAKHAQEISLEVVIINGKKLEQLRAYLNGDSFEGTKIR